MNRKLLIVSIISLLITMCWLPIALAQTTQPADDAAKLYLQAGRLVADNAGATITPPSARNAKFPAFPPFGDDWFDIESLDFQSNAQARALVHQARAMNHANWPDEDVQKRGSSSLAYGRMLANDLADAALYQHFQKDDAAAIETLRDQWHLAELVQTVPAKAMSVMLGENSIGIFAERLNIITASVALTKDPANTKNLQVSQARELIAQLLKHEDPKAHIDKVLHAQGAAANDVTNAMVQRLIPTITRNNAECDMAAMSLACHLYKLDKGTWPPALADLHDYLPALPIDPFGDGKQTMGYVLVKAGLPDGSDRPLVYCRPWARRGLFYRTDRPFYGFDNGDGSDRPGYGQRQGGQFRDVASWAPPEGYHPAAATRPVQ